MTQLKHTPGPWRIQEGLAAPKANRKYRQLYIAGKRSVAEVENYAYNTPIDTDLYKKRIEEMEANAKLIAAAPVLLDALHKAVDQLRQICGPHGDYSYYESILEPFNPE